MKNIVTVNTKPAVLSLSKTYRNLFNKLSNRKVIYTLAISLVSLLLLAYTTPLIALILISVLLLGYIVKIIRGIMRINVSIVDFSITDKDIEADLWY